MVSWRQPLCCVDKQETSKFKQDWDKTPTLNIYNLRGPWCLVPLRVTSTQFLVNSKTTHLVNKVSFLWTLEPLLVSPCCFLFWPLEVRITPKFNSTLISCLSPISFPKQPGKDHLQIHPGCHNHCPGYFCPPLRFYLLARKMEICLRVNTLSYFIENQQILIVILVSTFQFCTGRKGSFW